MASTLEIAFIAAGSAVGGSPITGGLAYLGMRHQTSNDRNMRLVEARRTAYAQLMAVAFDSVNYLSMQRSPWRGEVLRREVLALMSRTTAAIGEVRLLASERVIDSATELMEAVIAGAQVAFDALAEEAEKGQSL